MRNCSGCGTGNARKATTLRTEKTALFAPIPSARAKTTVNAKDGLARSVRNA
jgi:hypothetical protein